VHGSVLLAAPVPGATADSIYAVTASGRLLAYENGQTWVTQLFSAAGGTVVSSPTLDCNRLQAEAGRPGVLYAQKDNGRLVAVLVDAPKLSPTALWPRYQKDVANSGNDDVTVFPKNPGCP
jgi:hypothetical protein